MKILLVIPQFDVIPVGISFISASLKKAGHAVECFVYDNAEELKKKLLTKYGFVATGGLSFLSLKLKVISEIVKASGNTLVLGGGIITSEPELMSRFLEAEYVVIGEGEDTIVELASCLENRSDVQQVAGIGYFKDDVFVQTRARQPIDKLDELPFPDYESFGYKHYLDTLKPMHRWYDVFDYPREYPIITSRSCPYSCTFCYHPLGKKYRQRSLDSIFKELQEVMPKYRINIIAIFDELFSYDEKRVLEFCDRFKALSRTIPWEVKWICSLRVEGLKESVLDALVSAGCFMVGFGFESYSPTVLKSMNKSITPQQIHKAVHATLERKISIQANFIFGDKAETMETAKETLKFWADHIEAGILLFFVLALPNSEIYQHCIRKSIIKDKLDFINHHLFDVLNMTSLTEEQFMELRLMVAKHIHGYSVYAVPLKRTKNSVEIRCPFCKSKLKFKNYITPPLIFFFMMHCRVCRKQFYNVSALYKIAARLARVLFSPLLYRIFQWTKRLLGIASPRLVFKDLARKKEK